ncbi:MAG: molybdopterin molybdotransferase MoeA, partial [Oscillospiraceae bacterium]|nr:molybdopterin molybdotransferase MoeA [Oscillospiraceae bacterium]
MRKQIDIREAFRLLDTYKRDPGTEELALEECLDRILAEDIRAALPVPPFRKSPFDGYACRAADLPGCLRVVGEAATGTGLLPVMGPGEAVRIFTGAPVPDRADVVLKQEDVQAEKGEIRVNFAAEAGTNVICPGEDLQYGDLLLSKGSRLLPAHLGVLASQGIGRIRVFRRPLAVIIPTGSELSEPGEERSIYGIYNSSYYALSGYLRRLGFRVKNGGIVPDEAEQTHRAVQEALDSEADVVI